jgi:hypothetical protein
LIAGLRCWKGEIAASAVFDDVEIYVNWGNKVGRVV